jgi:hypothetical protein
MKFAIIILASIGEKTGSLDEMQTRINLENFHMDLVAMGRMRCWHLRSSANRDRQRAPAHFERESALFHGWIRSSGLPGGLA